MAIKRCLKRPVDSPFLFLPTELRLQIYKYLVPNRRVWADITLHTHKRYFVQQRATLKWDAPVLYFRHDEQPCYPALLRANHQIYSEFVEVFYGTAWFAIEIAGSYLSGLGMEYVHRTDTLPTNLRYIRNLRLTMWLHWPEGGVIDAPAVPWLTLLLNLNVMPKLRRIQLGSVLGLQSTVRPTIESIDSDGGEQLNKVMEWNLGPLRTYQSGTLDLNLYSYPIRLQMYDDEGMSNNVGSEEVNQMERLRTRFLTKFVAQIEAQRFLREGARSEKGGRVLVSFLKDGKQLVTTYPSAWPGSFAELA